MSIRIAISMGDPSGIGPEVIAKALNALRGRLKNAVFSIAGDGGLLSRYGLKARSDISIIPGNISAADSGTASLSYLAAASSLVKKGQADCLVTGPIAKKKVRDCGFLHAGQTEFLGHFFKTKHVEMVFVSKPLKVVLVTRHMALKDAVSAIKKRRIVTCGRLVCDLLKKNFRIKSPKIAVCGLNPHAGEGGLFGLEEKLEIAPAIRQLNKILGNYFYGPFPADTIFSRALRSEFDMVMAMYHDQGLIPFKVAEFEQGVNLTAGLPFIRTSPVHGTAFDIAGKNLADHRSMQSAIELAYQLTQ